MITCIAGGPGVGKTHLGARMALALRCRLHSTDDVIAEVAHLPKHEQWSAVSEIVARRLVVQQGPAVYEGVRIVHALRKALELTPLAPCVRLIVLRGRHEDAGPELDGQARMAKAIETVLTGIRDRLVGRGVEIEERGVLPSVAPVADMLRAARRSWKVMA